MKAIVLETRNGETVLLRDDGEIVKLRMQAAVGETVELPDAPLQLPRAKQPWLRTAIAASLALAVGAGAYTYLSVPAGAYVSLDAGEKSVELAVNRLGRIVSVEPKNKASIELASQLSGNVQGKQMSAAIKTTVETLQNDGAFDQGESYLIAGVTANAPTTETEITQIVEETTSAVQEAPVEIYTITVTDEERQEAEKTEQSAGSYAFDNREEEERDERRAERRKKRREARRAKRREERRKKRQEKRRKEQETSAELLTETQTEVVVPEQQAASEQSAPSEQTAPVETTETAPAAETPVPAAETAQPAAETTEPAAEQPPVEQTEEQTAEQTEEQTDAAEDAEGDAPESEDASEDEDKEQKKQERKEKRRKKRRNQRKKKRQKERKAKKNAKKGAKKGEQSEAVEETDAEQSEETE